VVSGLSSLRYLQTSPEFAMKRLLAAGSGAIYQLCKAFRSQERGAKHNPEFTILEWYQPGYSLDDLIQECQALLTYVGICSPTKKITYRSAFLTYADLDPFTCSDEYLQTTAERCSGMSVQGWRRDDYLDVILSHLVEPHLGQNNPEFLTDYPASQAALAKVCKQGELIVAKRFELYMDGLELANGYQELTDANEQRHRFAQDNLIRQNKGLPEIPPDAFLLSALHSGMPECSGVALGVDRLLMVLSDTRTIDDVLGFPEERI